MSESIISSNSETKKCPFCGEIIKGDTIICLFCNMALKDHASNESGGKLVNIQVGIAFNGGDNERNADQTREKTRNSHFYVIPQRLIIGCECAISSVTTYAGFRRRQISRGSGGGLQTWASEPCKSERSPRSSDLNDFCALPWSKAERQGASMAISR